MTVASADECSVKLLPGPAGQATLCISGRLESRTLLRAWDESVKWVQSAAVKTLVIDGKGVSYCDGAGLGLFAELRRLAVEAGAELRFEGFAPELQRLLSMSMLKDAKAEQLKPRPRPGIAVQTGKAAAGIFHDLGQMVAFVGAMVAALGWALTHPRKVRWRNTLNIAEKAGADALGVVCLLGLLIGLILAFQTANPLQRFGAQPLIPTIVSIAVVREMGPLITAVIVAGRSGSAFAAEIGTMKVTEELAALKTMGLEPTQFLVLPRVLAAIIVMPLLTVFNMLTSIVGAYIVMASLGYSLSFYVNQVRSAIQLEDFLGGVFKSFVFALIVAGIGCLRGTQTGSGPGAVGDSTTRAVVAGIVLAIAADAVLGIVYYYMGI